MSYAKIQTLLTKFNLENLENPWGGVNLYVEKFNNNKLTKTDYEKEFSNPYYCAIRRSL